MLSFAEYIFIRENDVLNSLVKFTFGKMSLWQFVVRVNCFRENFIREFVGWGICR